MCRELNRYLQIQFAVRNVLRAGERPDEHEEQEKYRVDGKVPKYRFPSHQNEALESLGTEGEAVCFQQGAS